MNSHRLVLSRAYSSAIHFRILLFIVVPFFFSQTGCDMSSHGGWRLAKYKNFHLESDSITRPDDPDNETFTAFSTDQGVVYKELASIYIELPGGERYLLEELPEEKVAQYFIKDDRAARGRGRL